MTIVLALDFGTGGVRGGLYDTDTAIKLAEADVDCQTNHPVPGRAEQNPEDWWTALCALVARLKATSGIGRVEAISLSTTASTVVFCDRQGRPIAPAILWMDARAAAESDFTGTIRHSILETCGGSCASEWLVPKAMWMVRHHPEVWAQTEIVCEALDYINFRLTGRWVGSRMNATCKWTYDARIGGYHEELLAAFGIPELIGKLPPEIVPVGGMVGTLCAAAADAFGLNRDALVIECGIDAHIGMFGANTLAPGQLLAIGGTSTAMLTNIPDDGSTITGFWGPYPHAAIEGLRLIEAGQVSSGAILRWLTHDIFGLHEDGIAALNAAAGKLTPNATGLIALDFWMGNRTPYRDPRLRGAILGLSLGHDRAAIYAACVTAIALGALNVTDRLQIQGLTFERMVIAGGIVRNDYWLNATIDAIGFPAELVRDGNLTLIGGAVLAAVAAGGFADVASAAEALMPPVELREPDLIRHRTCRDMLEHYRELTELLAPELHRLADSATATQ